MFIPSDDVALLHSILKVVRFGDEIGKFGNLASAVVLVGDTILEKENGGISSNAVLGAEILGLRKSLKVVFLMKNKTHDPHQVHVRNPLLQP